MPLSELDAKKLLSFLRSQVSRSRFAALDVAAMEGAARDLGLRRVVRYLDQFVQMVSERSSGAAREIEGMLGEFLEIEGGSFEGVEIELTPFESEVRQRTLLSLRDLGDSEDLIVPLRQLSIRIKEEIEGSGGLETEGS